MAVVSNGYVGNIRMVTDRADPNTIWNKTDLRRIQEATVTIINTAESYLGLDLSIYMPDVPVGFDWWAEDAYNQRRYINGIKEAINAELPDCPSFDFLTCDSANEIERLLCNIYASIYQIQQPIAGAAICGA